MRRSVLASAAAAALAVGLLVATPPAADAVTPTPLSITFTSDTAGAVPNGYASPDSPSVLFYDTMGADLQIADFGNQSHGQALAVNGDDASALEIRLANPTTAISLAFGNDDPNYSNVTDMAQLTLFRGATQVGQVDVNFNANDAMDQRIGFSAGPLFNRATLQYVDAAGTPLNLLEIVDDITLNPLCTVAGNANGNVLNGTPGNDVICGGPGNDTISAGGGNDIIYPGPGADQVSAGAGNDTVLAGDGNDTVSGGRGADDLRGQLGRDTLYGNGGRDALSGGDGRDSLNGGIGVDTCDGGPGTDRGFSCETHVRIP